MVVFSPSNVRRPDGTATQRKACELANCYCEAPEPPQPTCNMPDCQPVPKEFTGYNVRLQNFAGQFAFLNGTYAAPINAAGIPPDQCGATHCFPGGNSISGFCAPASPLVTDQYILQVTMNPALVGGYGLIVTLLHEVPVASGGCNSGAFTICHPGSEPFGHGTVAQFEGQSGQFTQLEYDTLCAGNFGLVRPLPLGFGPQCCSFPDPQPAGEFQIQMVFAP